MKNPKQTSRMAQRTSNAADSVHAKQVNKMFADSAAAPAGFWQSLRFWQQWRKVLHRANLTRRRQWQDSWRRLKSKPWSNGWLIVMLGAVLFLPLAFFLVFQNIITLQQGLITQPTASVFLRTDQPQDYSLEQLAMRLRQREGVVEVSIIPKNEGLEQLRQASGFSAEWLASLEHNPLPDALLLTLDTAQIRDLDGFRDQLVALPEVEHVTLDVIWLQRLGWLVTLLQRIAGLLTVALGLVVVLTIANTIRLTVENARAEIQVGWLVGASQGFLRRPFLYLGALYGFFGAMAALLLVAAAAWWLHEPAQSLLTSYIPNGGIPDSGIANSGTTSSWPIAIEMVLGMVVVSVLLGWMGAGLALRSVLAKMLPDAS